MKIGIVTLPFYKNYGGILQCYALQTYLERKFKADVFIIRSDTDNRHPFRKFLSYIKRNISSGNSNNPGFYDYYPGFVTSKFKFLSIKKSGHELDLLIVGSDQIWRQDFFPNSFGVYFCNFATEKQIKKISYAASFGVDRWTYDVKKTEQIKNWLTAFDGISVREKSAVDLCVNNLGLTVEQVVDPTLLLDSTCYKELLSDDIESYDIFIYWLGEKEKIESTISKSLLNGNTKTVYLRDDSTLCDIDKWISLIANSALIITDSFHGCVFSILFHKQFVVFENESGGNSRIYTLLSGLGLLDRICKDNLDDIYDRSLIDYAEVDKKIINLKSTSIKFLNKHIK